LGQTTPFVYTTHDVVIKKLQEFLIIDFYTFFSDVSLNRNFPVATLPVRRARGAGRLRSSGKAQQLVRFQPLILFIMPARNNLALPHAGQA
jgi:hypothetical protein